MSEMLKNTMGEDIVVDDDPAYPHLLLVSFRAANMGSFQTRQLLGQLAEQVCSQIDQLLGNVLNDRMSTYVFEHTNEYLMRFRLSREMSDDERDTLASQMEDAFHRASFPDMVVGLSPLDPSRKSCAGQRTEFLVSRTI